MTYTHLKYRRISSERVEPIEHIIIGVEFGTGLYSTCYLGFIVINSEIMLIVINHVRVKVEGDLVIINAFSLEKKST